MALAPSAQATAAKLAADASRAEALSAVAAGRLDIESLVGQAASDRAVARIRIVAALTALPGWGPTKAERTLGRLGWDEGRRLQWLLGAAGSSRLRRLLEEVVPSPPPTVPRSWPWFDGRVS